MTNRYQRQIVVIALAVVLIGAWAKHSSAQGKKSRPRLPDGVRTIRDVSNAHVGDKPLLLDLYLPVKSTGRRPLIVWVHGGGWRAGSKDRCPAVKMVTHGFAVASIDYRLSHEAIFPAQIQDCQAAIRWLRASAEKYEIDAKRIGVWGSSAGGHLVALLGTAGDEASLGSVGGHKDRSSRVQAVCDWYGPTDFLKMDEQLGDLGRFKHSAPESPESKLVGGFIVEHPEKVARANPITYVSAGDPPFLIMHGDQDPLVPYQQSEMLRDALKHSGVEVALRIIKGAGHGGKQFNAPEEQAAVQKFFDRHLKRSK